MANIYCTKKLESLIVKKKVNNEAFENSLLGDWNGNIFNIGRKKVLLLTHSITFYSLLLPITQKDLINLHEQLYDRLINQMNYDKIHFPKQHLLLLKRELTPIFLKTNNNRRVLGWMNSCITDTQYIASKERIRVAEEKQIAKLNHYLNDNWVSIPKSKEMLNPIEQMQGKINQTYK